MTTKHRLILPIQAKGNVGKSLEAAARACWLNERGVTVTLSSVHRYCQRAVARRPRADDAPQPLANTAFAISKPTTNQETQTKTGPEKFRFNIED